MRPRASARQTRLSAPRASEGPIEPFSFVLDDGEDGFCDPYLVAGRDRDIPALEEYLQALRLD